jgi:hypothetical protein
MARITLISAAAWLCLSPMAHGFDHEHDAFTALLQAHVTHGRVSYAGLVEQETVLANYLASLASVSSEDIAGWDEPQQLAFWINAYNALTLDTVVAHYPLKRRGLRGFAFPSSSIQQIEDVWKVKRRMIGGEIRSLDDIEHGIIRAAFNEPRIHFALVCAAVSCPPLRSEAYRATQLETQLTEQLANFVADPARGLSIDTRRKRISISAIFKWFSEDFALPAGFTGELAGTTQQAGVVYLLAQAARQSVSATLQSRDYRVDYLRYDWALNE